MQAVCKALDSLVADGKISSKTYNKQTVYVADQVVHILAFRITLFIGMLNSSFLKNQELN